MRVIDKSEEVQTPDLSIKEEINNHKNSVRSQTDTSTGAICDNGTSPSNKILLVIENKVLAQLVKAMLTSLLVIEFDRPYSLEAIIQDVQIIQPSLLILESPFNNSVSTLEVAEKIKQKDRRFPIVLVTIHGSEALAISALKLGFKGYFTPPFQKQEFIDTINQCLFNYRIQNSAIKNHSKFTAIEQDQKLIGNGFQFNRIKTSLKKIAAVDSNVLITGETGTGKEMVAQYIHQLSDRYSKPFIAINCAAIPDGLLESELFGYEKGSFTGAQTSYVGKLKLANGGAVFFDEIGDMSPYAQAKILRVIESKEVYPLGAKKTVSLDIRVIAATNCDLKSKILNKEFRQDLYYRLNVAHVELPSLRKRKEDIPCLIEYFIAMFNKLSGRSISGISDEALKILLEYDWPGNVRELKNFIEAIFIDPPKDRIDVKNLPECIRCVHHSSENDFITEREEILKALRSVHWNKSRAAEQLNWSRMTLYRKMAKYQILDSDTNSTSGPLLEKNL
ncbi:MAG: sigma 54-interacting transcriptional regulator [Methylobacter sp.]